ncbi:MAG: hypothetical protein DCF19_00830 [Pseudanabaena frigida]|uniref:Uncharacterized protein n=1 Tax=Pseudanabaena frigida TaxID=945775 RepID=A0A2W4YQC4_9CYAN|nr:MAG: hypothetical protein DCF19_00830 [Pseudanabaena frigida]
MYYHPKSFVDLDRVLTLFGLIQHFTKSIFTKNLLLQCGGNSWIAPTLAICQGEVKNAVKERLTGVLKFRHAKIRIKIS